MGIVTFKCNRLQITSYFVKKLNTGAPTFWLLFKQMNYHVFELVCLIFFLGGNKFLHWYMIMIQKESLLKDAPDLWELSSALTFSHLSHLLMWALKVYPESTLWRFLQWIIWNRLNITLASAPLHHRHEAAAVYSDPDGSITLMITAAQRTQTSFSLQTGTLAVKIIWL